MTEMLRRLVRSRILYALAMVVLGAAASVYAIVAPGVHCLTWYASGLTLGFGFAWWLSLWTEEA